MQGMGEMRFTGAGFAVDEDNAHLLAKKLHMDEMIDLVLFELAANDGLIKNFLRGLGALELVGTEGALESFIGDLADKGEFKCLGIGDSGGDECLAPVGLDHEAGGEVNNGAHAGVFVADGGADITGVDGAEGEASAPSEGEVCG